MMKLYMLLVRFVHLVNHQIIGRLFTHLEESYFHSTLGKFGKGAFWGLPHYVCGENKVFMYDNTSIQGGARIIINPNGEDGKFIMKRWSGAASNLTVITGNHLRKVGMFRKQLFINHTKEIDKDVIVEEDVWIGANVTLLAGVTIGRGATVAAGSVVNKDVLPYSVYAGVPAKFKKFYWTVEQILEHEAQLYPVSERLSREKLEAIFHSVTE